MPEINLTTIAEVLCDEAQGIITRKPPSDTYILRDEYAAWLKRFYEKGYLLPSELRCGYLNALVTLTKGRILFCFGLLTDTVSSTFSDEYSLVSTANRKLSSPRPLSTTGPDLHSRVDLNKILIDLMTEIMPDFKLQKCGEASIAIKFGKKVLPNRKFYIRFDHGTLRQWTDITIGMDKPEFYIDIAMLFGSGQSMIPYADISAFHVMARETLLAIQPLIAALFQKFAHGSLEQEE